MRGFHDVLEIRLSLFMVLGWNSISVASPLSWFMWWDLVDFSFLELNVIVVVESVVLQCQLIGLSKLHVPMVFLQACLGEPLKMNLYSNKIFYSRTLYAGKFNIMGVLVGLQKPNFLHWKTLYLANYCTGNTVSSLVKLVVLSPFMRMQTSSSCGG
jgi:hypothetical protein